MQNTVNGSGGPSLFNLFGGGGQDPFSNFFDQTLSPFMQGSSAPGANQLAQSMQGVTPGLEGQDMQQLMQQMMQYMLPMLLQFMQQFLDMFEQMLGQQQQQQPDAGGGGSCGSPSGAGGASDRAPPPASEGGSTNADPGGGGGCRGTPSDTPRGGECRGPSEAPSTEPDVREGEGVGNESGPSSCGPDADADAGPDPSPAGEADPSAEGSCGAPDPGEAESCYA